MFAIAKEAGKKNGPTASFFIAPWEIKKQQLLEIYRIKKIAIGGMIFAIL